MKTPNDTHTQDMHPNGAPAFELDHTDAWPFPEPLPEWKPKQPAEPTIREWLMGVLKR